MIRKKFWKGIALFLAAGMLLTGCGNRKHPDSGKKPDDQEIMGRYVEDAGEEVDVFSRIGCFTQLADGTLKVFDHNNGFLISNDNGKSWSAKACKSVDDKLGTIYSQAGAIARDGAFIWGYAVDATEEEADTDQQSWNEIYQTIHSYFYISPEGKEVDLVFPGMDGQGENDYLSGFWFAPDGTLFAGSYSGKLFQVDTESSSLTEILEADTEIGLTAFTEKYLVAISDKKAILYDLAAGEVRKPDEALNQFIGDIVGESSVKYSSGNYSLYVTGTGEDTLYLTCPEGIFRHTIDGGTMEKLLEGTLFSIGDPTSSFWGMQLLGDNEFLVQMLRLTSRMYYDPGMPAVPDRTLRVFSMEKDDALQRAVNLFQRKHQDIYVQYETGLTGNDGRTRDDVIKSLNTEIIAGNGPDVISLGELPMDSYIKKGMLEDISATMDQVKKEGNYFENILEAYRKDGKIYAVPVRFGVPLLLGSQEEIKGADSLDALAEAVKKLREKKPEGTIIDTYEASNTLTLLAMVSGSAWLDEDGSLMEENISDFLVKAKEIYELEIAGLDESDMEYYHSLNEMYISEGIDINEIITETAQHATNAFLNPYILSMGAVRGSQMDFESLTSVKRQADGIDYGLFQGQGGRVFFPDLIVGISSRSEEKELAKEFMKTLLSADTLENVYGGFNVSRDALDRQISVSQETGNSYGSMGILQKDGSVAMLDLYEIQEHDKQWLYDTISSLDTGYLPDNNLQKAVIEAGCKVLEENMDIAKAVEEIKQKVQLYLAE